MTRVLAIDQLMVDRFHAKSRANDGGCIDWQGEIDRDGYGKYPVCRNGQKKRWMAHRFAYIITKGEIPDGYHVDHLCRNRRCVNPDHLEAVTPRENHDRWSTAMTRCRRGHEYTAENTRTNAKGGRVCRACVRLRAQQTYWRDPETARDRARLRRAS